MSRISYNIELISQLIVVLAISITYGVIESLYIPTDKMALPLFGRWSYYHIGLVVIMLFASFSLAISHIQWIFSDRKKYILFMCLASFPLSLMIEDLSWFVARWVPITRNEWTMMHPGLGINLGFSWCPLWYIVVIVWAVGWFWLANRCAEVGYKVYTLDRLISDENGRNTIAKILIGD